MTPGAHRQRRERLFTRRRLLTLLRRLYAVLIVALLAYIVVTERHDIARTARGAKPWVLVLVLVVAVGQLTMTSAFWASALRGFGEPVGWRTSLDATLASTPARYIPGSIWYAVGRATTLRRKGATAQTLTAVAGLELVLVPVVGFAMGGLTFAASSGDSPVTGWQLAVAVVVLAVLGSPPVVNAVLARVSRWRRREYRALTWGLHARLVAWTAAMWVWAAASFVVYLKAFPAIHAGGPFVVAGAYMVAWGVGWLAIFAPQGVGVFEATMAALLTGQTRAGLALIIAGYRAVIAVRDVLCFLAVMAVRRRQPR